MQTPQQTTPVKTAQQTTSVVAPKASIGNFLNFPATQKFLTDNLREKRTEFVSNLLALVDNDAKLSECDPQKLMLCAMNATALNLPLNKNLGYAYIVPYNGVPSFQIGYRGLIQLAMRSSQYKHINACEVREGEMVRNKFTGEIRFLSEMPENPVIGYVAYIETINGFSASLYMSEAEVERHAMKFSKMYQYDKKSNTKTSKWSDPDIRPKMALKTVLKGLLGTYGMLSPEIVTALAHDNDSDSDNETQNTSSRGSGYISDVTPVQDDSQNVKTESVKTIQI